MSWLDDIRCYGSEETNRMVAESAEVIRSCGLEHSRIGLVAADLAVDEMSVSLQEHLCTQLPRVHFEPASDLLNGLRLIKSQQEIKNLREAARLADFVAERFRKVIRPGEKDCSATAAAEQAARKEGADACFILVSTHPSHLAMVPCNFEFREKSVVTCEITVQLHEYWVQVCRVYSVGKPSSVQREVFAVCRKAYESVVAAARPGNSVDALVEAAQTVIAGAGYKDYIQYSTGHGVGLDLPELYPLVSECKASLSSNMVLVVHPAIWIPNEAAAFLGGPIAITEQEASQLGEPQGEIIEV